nr:phytanoyl-CoA dioxygenase family protein [Hyphomonas sp. Mor2]
MDIGDWSATPILNELYKEIREKGLETNLAELEAFGFTTIPGALSPDEVSAMRARILELSEERLGMDLDPDTLEQRTTPEGVPSDVALIPFLLYHDPIFKKAVVNEKSLSLITYLLGRQCLLSSLTCHLKGPGGPGLPIHSDNGLGIPESYGMPSMVANCNFALTDYTEEGGCFAVVPGSHRLARQPKGGEQIIADEQRYKHVIPVEVPAGTAIIWHGNTWHGSYPRKTPGLRINLSTYYCRESLQTQENYADTVPEGFLDPIKEERLARLLGSDLVYGWQDEGPIKLYERMAKPMPGGLPSWQA